MYEFLDHTADLAVRVYAPTLPELFKNCALTMFDIIKPQCQFRAAVSRTVSQSGPQLEILLVDWLRELLSVFAADRFLPVQYNIDLEERDGQWVLTGSYSAAQWEDAYCRVAREVKAVTHHGTQIEEGLNGFTAVIIFDV